MSVRPVVTGVGIVLLLTLLAGAVYLLGERGCPPPAWAFWRNGDGGTFACIVGR